MVKLKNPFLKGFINGFTSFGHIISSVVNAILLFLTYVIGAGLTSIIAKICRKRFLAMDLNKESFWVKREQKKKTHEDHYRPF